MRFILCPQDKAIEEHITTNICMILVVSLECLGVTFPMFDTCDRNLACIQIITQWVACAHATLFQ